MICPNCGGETKSENKFCEYCSSELPIPQPQNVDNHVEHNSRVVQNITYNVTNTYQQPIQQPTMRLSPKNKGTAIFLCCLGFIGLGGLHRFYVGKKISGIIYFCTFGWFFIGTIVDLVQLSKGKATDSNGLYLK